MLAKMPLRRYSDYDPFAWVYNKHWGTVFLPVALGVVEKKLLPRLPQGARVLDLCCGTGQLAAKLSDRGYHVTGLDGSAMMLRYARRNAPRAEFELADARHFSTQRKFDAITCMFDSLNHIMSTEELTSTFECVNAALEETGLLLFDFTTEASFLAHGEGIYGFVESDHVCVQVVRYDSDTRFCTYETTLFRLLRGAWHRSDFSLKQRPYEEIDVRAAVTKAGFGNIQVYGYDLEQGIMKLSPDSRRAFFLCSKK